MSQDKPKTINGMSQLDFVQYSLNNGRSFKEISEELEIELDDLHEFISTNLNNKTLRLLADPNDTLDFFDLRPQIDAVEEVSQPLHPLQEFGNILGEGGMGRVVEATQHRLKRRVAVKQIRPAYKNTVLSRRLVQEALITGMLEHPNIIPIYDIWDASTGAPQIVMKKIKGRVWSEILDQELDVADRLGRRFIEQQLTLLCRVCDAVAYAHSRGVIHRDLKPDNVMIGEFGAVYVLDWGIAASIDENCPQGVPLVRDERSPAGTPTYMAPEMATGDAGLLGFHSDVYLLGGILHTILTGKPLRVVVSTPEGIESIRDWKYVVPENLPGRLAEILNRALARDPKERYSSVLEFQSEVEQYRDRLEIYEILSFLRHNLKVLLKAIDENSIERNELYQELAVVRFQYEQVVRQIGEHVDITPSYLEFLTVLIRWELEQGEIGAAATLYHENGINDPVLASEIDQFREKRSQNEVHLQKFKDLSNHNLEVRARVFVTATAFLLFALVPIVRAFGIQLSPIELTLTSFAELGIMTCLGIWARDALFRTRINRLNFAFLICVMVVMTFVGVLSIFINNADPIAYRQVALVTLFIVYTGVISLRLLPATVILFASIIYGYLIPAHYFLSLLVSHLAIFINLCVMWWPHFKDRIKE